MSSASVESVCVSIIRAHNPETTQYLISTITILNPVLKYKDISQLSNCQFSMPEVTHPMLHITELILEFMGYLEDPYDKRDINTAGLVCKSWHESAMDIKWRTAHLLSLLSMAMLAPLQNPLNGKRCFQHLPTRGDWTRFHRIARRVSILKPAGLWRVADSVWEVLRAQSDNASGLLPNLQQLDLLITIPTPLFIFPSTLNQLTITIINICDASQYIQIPSAISSRFPRLSKITLNRFRGTKECHDALATMFSQLKGLRSVSLEGQSLSTEVISALASLPSLQVLSVYGLSEGVMEPFQWKPSVGVFPELLELSVECLVNKSIATLITDVAVGDSERHPQRQSLYSLSLNARHRDIATDLPAVFQAISLHVGLVKLLLNGITVETLVIATLEPLRTCTALQSLFLRIHTPKLNVTREYVVELLARLPTLKTCYVSLGQGCSVAYSERNLD